MQKRTTKEKDFMLNSTKNRSRIIRLSALDENRKIKDKIENNKIKINALRKALGSNQSSGHNSKKSQFTTQTTASISYMQKEIEQSAYGTVEADATPRQTLAARHTFLGLDQEKPGT